MVAQILLVCLGSHPTYAAAPTPIYSIQGATGRSPLDGQIVDAVGIVTGVTPTGFYLQDPTGDGDPVTSDGIFVYTFRRPSVSEATCVAVHGARVDEFYAKTELNRAGSYGPVGDCVTHTVAPASLPAVLPGQSTLDILEPFEGMLVERPPLRAVVYGPTKRFAGGELEIALLPATLQPYLVAGAIPQSDPAAQAGLIFLSNLLGASLPDANRGEFLTSGPLVGVLDYNFGKYQLLPLPGSQLAVEPAPGLVEPAAPALLAEQPGDYTICSFNVHGLGRGQAQFPQPDEYAGALVERAATIAGPLQGCTVVALQETGTLAVAEDLAATLDARFELPYVAGALPGSASHDAEFPLTNSLLVRQDRGRVLDLDQVQGCSTRDFDLSAPGACPAGLFPVFDRPPLVAQVEVGGAEPQRIWIINNHWKSKSGDESANARLRSEQAAAVARAVQALIDAEPAAQVVVLGDLNDYYGGPAVDRLSRDLAPPLVHSLERVTPLDRYTYIFNGATQVLDHVLTTPNLATQIAAAQIAHVNAAFATGLGPEMPGYATSDHDPLRLVIRPAGAATIAGNVTFAGVTVTARDDRGAVVAAAVSDAQGEFRLWGLAPEPLTLYYAPPPYVALGAAHQPVAPSNGHTVIVPPAAQHHTALLAAWVAVAGPDLVDSLMADSAGR